MAICLDKVSSLALGSVGMSVWQEGCRVFPMCGFAGGFLGMVASLILSKGTQVVNVKISHTGVAVTTRNCGNDGALVGVSWPRVSSQFCEMESQSNGTSYDHALQRHTRVTYIPEC